MAPPVSRSILSRRGPDEMKRRRGEGEKGGGKKRERINSLFPLYLCLLLAPEREIVREGEGGKKGRLPAILSFSRVLRRPLTRHRDEKRKRRKKGRRRGEEKKKKKEGVVLTSLPTLVSRNSIGSQRRGVGHGKTKREGGGGEKKKRKDGAFRFKLFSSRFLCLSQHKKSKGKKEGVKSRKLRLNTKNYSDLWMKRGGGGGEKGKEKNFPSSRAEEEEGGGGDSLILQHLDPGWCSGERGERREEKRGASFLLCFFIVFINRAQIGRREGGEERKGGRYSSDVPRHRKEKGSCPL